MYKCLISDSPPLAGISCLQICYRALVIVSIVRFIGKSDVINIKIRKILHVWKRMISWTK